MTKKNEKKEKTCYNCEYWDRHSHQTEPFCLIKKEFIDNPSSNTECKKFIQYKGNFRIIIEGKLNEEFKPNDLILLILGAMGSDNGKNMITGLAPNSCINVPTYRKWMTKGDFKKEE